MAAGNDDDAINDLLDLNQLPESSVNQESEDMFLKNDNEVIDDEFGKEKLEIDNLTEKELLNDSELINNENEAGGLDINIENELLDFDLDYTESYVGKESLGGNDKEEVSPPKRKKKDESDRYKPLNLPLARIKQIIKMDPEVTLAGSEAVFLIAKATEMFIELLSKDAYAHTVASKKKTIQKKDVDAAILNSDCLIFLDGAMDF